MIPSGYTDAPVPVDLEDWHAAMLSVGVRCHVGVPVSGDGPVVIVVLDCDAGLFRELPTGTSGTAAWHALVDELAHLGVGVGGEA